MFACNVSLEVGQGWGWGQVLREAPPVGVRTSHEPEWHEHEHENKDFYEYDRYKFLQDILTRFT